MAPSHAVRISIAIPALITLAGILLLPGEGAAGVGQPCFGASPSYVGTPGTTTRPRAALRTTPPGWTAATTGTAAAVGTTRSAAGTATTR
jgi:hypothetical protein